MSSLFQSLKARLSAAAFACALALGTLTGPALAQGGNPAPATGPEKRIALVIGNSAYENTIALPNPANDARAMAQFLNSAGFEVIQATDLEHDEMIQVMQDFSAKIAERGPNTAAFVYYAGHGLQIAGENYLVPVDAKITSEADVANETVRLVDVMATLKAVQTRITAVVIDACRDNPFNELKDTSRGLAIVDAPTGSIVAYSTAPGTQAYDGEGKNSPYLTAFLRLGNERNLPIEQFFKKVRVVVNDVTDGKQTPWESSSLTSDFYFFGDTQVAAAKTIDPAQSQSVNASSRQAMVSQNLRTRNARDAYHVAIAEGSTEYYEEYVRIYPHDPYAAHIRRLLAAKLAAIAWHHAVKANSPSVYKSFYSQHADSPYATSAMRLSLAPKPWSLYQPTKIMVAPQIAPQVKLTNFNGVNIGQGNNAPIGLGGHGSLFNKKFGATQGLGNGGPGNQGGLGGQILGGNKLGPNLNGQGGAKVGLPNGGGIISNGPGMDLSKGKRFDTRIGNGRLTTLPGSGNNGVGQNGVGPLVKKDGRILNGNTGIAGKRIGSPNGGPAPGSQGNGQPLIKKFDNRRITNVQRPMTLNSQNGGSKPTFKRFQLNNGGGGGGLGGGSQFRSKPMNFGSGGGGFGGGSSRFAGGGGGFGRFR